MRRRVVDLLPKSASSASQLCKVSFYPGSSGRRKNTNTTYNDLDKPERSRYAPTNYNRLLDVGGNTSSYIHHTIRTRYKSSKFDRIYQLLLQYERTDYKKIQTRRKKSIHLRKEETRKLSSLPGNRLDQDTISEKG